MYIKVKDLYDIIDDLIQDCANDTILNENESELSDETLNLIYHNVKLFTLKLKDRIEEIDK